ncbi:MAG: phosphoribosylanthranilate isomerase [Actinomycetota bacterium]|nr:phosphoribosylanthranilate isomerase [Actinomycetota bacterium]
MTSATRPVLVKICGITSESDALLAVALGADAIGFVFAPSPRQMAPRAVQRIVERVPAEILTVGVFRDEAPQRVVEIANRIGLQAVQLHGSETAVESQWVASRVGLVIKAFPAGHPGIAAAGDYGAELVLVDAASPGSGKVFDWRLAEGVVDPSRLLVAGGLHAGNVADAIAHLGPRGVDVASGVESSPGTKDPRLLQAFIAEVRRASGGAGAGEVPGVSGGPAAGVARWAAGSRVQGAPAGADEEAEDGPFNWEVGR